MTTKFALSLAATLALAAAAPAASNAAVITPCPAGTDPGLAQAVQWLATQTTTPVSCIPITADQIPSVPAPSVIVATVTAPAAQTASTPATAPKTATKRLRAGEFCKRSLQRTYHRAGFTCARAANGRYRLRHT